MNNELMHYGVLGMKWGIRRYQNPDGTLTPEGKKRYRDGKVNTLANDVYRIAKEKEKKITEDVSKAADAANTNLYMLGNRLKTQESIARKIEKISEEKGVTYEEASHIKDAVRYTSVTSNSDFVNSYNKMKAALESKGYTESRCKNYFEQYKQGLVKHKSVTSNFIDPDGYEFEIQFHTFSSQSAKDKKTPIYEERRNVNISKDRAEYLEKQMVALAEKVPYPKNIDQIKSH